MWSLIWISQLCCCVVVDSPVVVVAGAPAGRDRDEDEDEDDRRGVVAEHALPRRQLQQQHRQPEKRDPPVQPLAVRSESEFHFQAC
ncbi:unnamed protein product [Linum tenue]|uniref:Secreted protein n=1 Tax=Linum tenue TaxID=586396 RepID=A0AAV0KJ53_9ROSI|nr:unnamed protein product [Linum tenue]